jgi:hypothetical protein
VHEVQVDVVETQLGQRCVEGFLDARVVCAPELCGDKDLGSLDEVLGEGALDPFADFGFVAVALCGVNVAIAGFQGVVDCPGYFARAGLPCSWFC